MSREDAEGALDGQIEKAASLRFPIGDQVFLPSDLQERFQKFSIWHERNKLLLESMFSDGRPLSQYMPSAFYSGGGSDLGKARAQNKNVELLVGKLRTIRENLDLIPDANPDEGKTEDGSVKEVFIVHGRSLHRDAVWRVVQQTTGREAIILQDEPDGGSPTVIEKLEREANRAGWAIVVLVGDDEGRLKGEPETNPRARQNVIAELGFFIGRLGRDKVKVVYEPGVELPSDFGGITYIELDEGDAWRGKLKVELIAMGVPLARGAGRVE